MASAWILDTLIFGRRIDDDRPMTLHGEGGNGQTG